MSLLDRYVYLVNSIQLIAIRKLVVKIALHTKPLLQVV